MRGGHKARDSKTTPVFLATASFCQIWIGMSRSRKSTLLEAEQHQGVKNQAGEPNMKMDSKCKNRVQFSKWACTLRNLKAGMGPSRCTPIWAQNQISNNQIWSQSEISAALGSKKIKFSKKNCRKNSAKIYLKCVYTGISLMFWGFCPAEAAEKIWKWNHFWEKMNRESLRFRTSNIL